MGPILEHAMRMRPPKHEVQLLLLCWVKPSVVKKKKSAKLLCKCLHVVIGTHGLSNMHNLGNETLLLENLSVIPETP